MLNERKIKLQRKCVYTRKVRGIISILFQMATEIKKDEFKSRDVGQDLGRLVKGCNEPVRDLVSSFEFAPDLGVLLSYTELLSD